MAQQTGILGIKGTVGGLVFAKDGSIRQKPASNKSTFNSSSSMVRVRENASEFGAAATAGKLVRDALRTQIQSASDRLMVSRLAKVMKSIINLDFTSDRGMRSVIAANAAQLVGFNFNQAAGLGQSLYSPYTVTPSGATVTLAIPSLNPTVDIAAPAGATHYEILFGVASVNFVTKTYRSATVASPLGILPLTGAAQANVSQVATLPAAPTADELVIGVLGMNYYQQLNGKYYPLNNNASNPLAVEYVSAQPITGGGSGGNFDTHLAGPNGAGAGITLAASAGDDFGFNELTTGGSAPASMDINVGGTQVASVAYLDRYTGQPFSFAHAGVTHTGAFAATVNF
ncbi:MAG: hypothetical protein ACRYFV_15420 [Janthinobacterium lividum]